MVKGIIVRARKGSGIRGTGVTTGGDRCCAMEGCSGSRIAVRWPERIVKGKKVKSHITWPCLKGMKKLPDGSFQIL